MLNLLWPERERTSAVDSTGNTGTEAFSSKPCLQCLCEILPIISPLKLKTKNYYQ